MRFAASSGRNIPDFTPQGLKSAGVTTNAGSAADAVSVGSIFGTLQDSSPDYDKIAATAATNRAEERVAEMNAEATMTQAGISAAGTVKAAEAQAEGMRAQAGATKKAGLFSAIGSIASAAVPLMMASDEDTKHTIDELEYACDILRELRPVTFFYKEEYSAHPERMHYGFIAQEYQKVMPDATYVDGTTNKLCIDPIELISILVRANQELQSRVTRLEAKQALVSV